MDEGYLNVTEAPKMPSGQQPLFGPGGMAKEAAQQLGISLRSRRRNCKAGLHIDRE